MHDISDNRLYDVANDPCKIVKIKNGDIKSSSIKKTVAKCIESKKLYYSIEITPKPNFKLNFEQFAIEPVFAAITWISDSNLKFGTVKKCPAIKLAADVSQKCPTLNHLTCYNLSYKDADEFLDIGVKNLFLIKGDEISEDQVFKYAKDLVNYFKVRDPENELTIGIAGIMPINDENLAFLKEKVT